MKTRNKRWKLLESTSHLQNKFSHRNSCTGQAVVEFTLCFMLMLVVAWIPADFGLMFYTAQMAQNASREAARLAASDPCLNGTNAVDCTQPGIAAKTGTCTYPCAATNDLLQPAAARLSSAIMNNPSLSISLSGSGCTQLVTATVAGDYNFSFYRMLRWFGANVPQTLNITRTTTNRWEHQESCT